MDKSELKKVLKPLIKECIKEVLLEHGVSSLVMENQTTTQQTPMVNQVARDERAKLAKENLERKKKKMLDAIGNDAYNGVNLFEGTTPAPAPRESGRGALSDVDPSDPGVDISSFMDKSSLIWEKMAGKNGK